MSPEAYLLARQRLELEAKDAKLLFAHDLAQINEGFSTKGTPQGHAVFARMRQEMEQRASRSWAAIQRILDADDADAGEETKTQIHELLRAMLFDLSEDVAPLYERYTRSLIGSWPTIDEARTRAMDLAISDVEIDLLRRKRRRLPLGDALRAPRYHAVFAHWSKARSAAESDPADAVVALKEGISAVEALAKVAIGDASATLGSSVKVLRSRGLLDSGLNKVLEGLWEYSNSMPGIRHGGGKPFSYDAQDWAILRPMLEGALVVLLRADVIEE